MRAVLSRTRCGSHERVFVNTAPRFPSRWHCVAAAAACVLATTPGAVGMAAGPLHAAKHRVRLPAAGSCSGSSSGGRVSLNVSTNRKQLQDVTAYVGLGCSPGGRLDDQISIAE